MTSADTGSDRRPFRRALLSVYDKTGIVDLARALHENGCEIVSTGSTASTIAQAGIPVTPVDAVTEFPEMLDGRVKTLHPHIHGGILADQRLESHRAQLAEHGIAAVDLVVVNLYPFEETVAAGGSVQDIIEKIDIGGPAMVRSAAKNHASCGVVVEASHYAYAAQAAARGGFTIAERRAFASLAFTRIAAYDLAIDEWFCEQAEQDVEDLGLTPMDVPSEQAAAELDDEDRLLELFESDRLAFEREMTDRTFAMDDEQAQSLGISFLRYGENSHQRAYLQGQPTNDGSLAAADLLGGKPMSYNNYVDADAALRAAYDHTAPCVAVIKHNNPCGIAIAADGEDLAIAHAKAHGTDPLSAYGGVIAANRPVTLAMAQQVKPIFTEVIVAPGYDEDALELLRTKKNLRILQISGTPRDLDAVESREIWGGSLVQERDRIDADGDAVTGWRLAAGDAADDATLRDLEFAWRCVRAVKSNAILLAADGAAVGIGMGQVNRLDSCRLAVSRANTLGEHAEGEVAPERARGAVAASDAFFPFADGVQILLDAGVRAIVQPGGSIRDDEVIAACEQAGVTLYLTGTRHFAH
ncbi:bifunctional phosphoribosylaminoimidazolecarboxamide formyltransferase/IMP cyclohydrolase [Brachybacterium timonense]|uniref:bifunctional phosphoribosylaminoimidazolecarboxamide formyltransferase/IMP cyclohydrolase n=1 Tax=Brachybacterium timonense TaxID=2050896 RepID=UPI000D0B406C|nr:bifunctional phosphoribosylaminoimidazolecarboxamide formyltransferase/IMP cyclohydrolase [Brachybacterium timonense]